MVISFSTEVYEMRPTRIFSAYRAVSLERQRLAVSRNSRSAHRTYVAGKRVR